MLLINIRIHKICLAIGLGVLFSGAALAQKAADLADGLKAPAGIKIDGKINEWGALPAFNKSTALHYSLANDASNLYLVIHSDDQTSINKILGGGITLTINKEGKKKEKDAVEVIYPFPARGSIRGMRLGQRGGRQGDNAVDTAALVATRKQAAAGMKELSITGIKDITDTLVSIYNTYGIKTGINIDAHGDFYYELALPLKLLELNTAGTTELAYNIKLNGIAMGGGNRDGGGRGEGGRAGGGQGGGFGGGGGSITISGGMGGAMMDLMTPTDFWGKYKLARP